MSEETNLPVVVIVGRPNVGKSTLFNAITGTRRAIVGDEPGITRDRLHVEAEHRGKRFELIDTGGIIPNDDQLIPSEILKQARVALDRAAHIILLIDGRAEITAPDQDLARMVRQLGKPVALAVNKIDAPVRESLAHDFYVLGFEHLFPISSEHRIGIEDLLDHITASYPATAEQDSLARATRIKVAIIGRPNAGKSTLLNALAGYERSIVTPVPGTTRDAVDEVVRHEDVDYVFVDTAGIRRKGKTKLMAEKLSVVMARKHIDLADVVLVVMDATEGVVALDATIAGYAHEGGKPVILCVNKWDAAEKKDKAAFVQQVRDALRYLEYAPIAFLSAKSGTGVKQLFGLIRRAWDSAGKRVGTGELNRFFEKLEKDPNFKIRYLTQAGVHPPTFVVFKDNDRPLHFSYERFLVNRIREKFGFVGTPVVVKARTKPRTPPRRRR
jgi:GTP-binding protein